MIIDTIWCWCFSIYSKATCWLLTNHCMKSCLVSIWCIRIHVRWRTLYGIQNTIIIIIKINIIWNSIIIGIYCYNNRCFNCHSYCSSRFSSISIWNSVVESCIPYKSRCWSKDWFSIYYSNCSLCCCWLCSAYNCKCVSICIWVVCNYINSYRCILWCCFCVIYCRWHNIWSSCVVSIINFWCCRILRIR